MQKLWPQALFLGSVLLTGCGDAGSSGSTQADPLLKSIVIKAPLSSPHKDAAYQIAEATKSASNSLAQLAKIQSYQHPDYYKTPQKVVKSNVKGTVSIDYIGPIEPLLKKLAKSANVKYRKLGKQTGTPIIVSVKYDNASLRDVVENIAYQAQNHAIVEVNKQGAVQIRYLTI